MRVIDGMKCFGSKISPRMWIDNNGQLICVGAIIARTGSYDYLESEIKENGDPNTVVCVYRTPEEVFNPVSMASFENKPFCDNHPEDDVTIKNYKNLQRGFMRNIRRGEGNLSDCLLADIIVTDENTINEIRSGDKRELSLGYDTNLEQDATGRWVMKNIRGNHLALVDSGRAGCATIRDSASKLKNQIGGTKMKLFRTTGQNARHRLYDEDIVQVEELPNDDEIELEELSVEQPKNSESEIPSEDVIDADLESPLQNDEGPNKMLWDAIHAIEARLDALEKSSGPQEEVTDDSVNSEEDGEDMNSDDMFEELDDEDETSVPDDLEYDDQEKDELLDADELEIQEKLEEPIRDRSVKSKDAASVYAKFTRLSDSKERLTDSEQAQVIWQARYDRASKTIR